MEEAMAVSSFKTTQNELTNIFPSCPNLSLIWQLKLATWLHPQHEPESADWETFRLEGSQSVGHEFCNFGESFYQGTIAPVGEEEQLHQDVQH